MRPFAVVVWMLSLITSQFRSRKGMSSSVRIGFFVGAVAVSVDQLSKWWILVKVMDPPKVIEVTPFFNLVLTWNRNFLKEPSAIWSLFTHTGDGLLSSTQKNLQRGPRDKCLVNILSASLLAAMPPKVRFSRICTVHVLITRKE